MTTVDAFYIPNAKQQFLDGNGAPLAGASVYMYVPTTTTFKNTWQDSGQVSLNTNPIILDGNGEAIIYGSGNYRQRVVDVNNNLVWDQVVSAGDYGLLGADNNLSDVANPATALSNLGGAPASALTGLVPPGMVFMYAKSTAPTGYLECNGSAVLRSTYSALFAVIGTTFGPGDGTTTFNLPDFRGYFPRGWADSGTIDPGRAFGSTQTDAIKSHTSTSTVTDPTHGHGAPSRQSGSDGGGYIAASNNPDGNAYIAPASTGISVATAYTGATETRGVNLAILFMIKT